MSRIRSVARKAGRKLTELAIEYFIPVANVSYFPDNTVFLTSYPKSGNTWVRIAIAMLKHPGREITLDSATEIVPDIYLAPPASIRGLSRPRVVKSHDPFEYRYPRTIYVVRDPRSVLVSFYFYLLRNGLISEETALRDFIPTFLEGTKSPFGSWGRHVRSWMAVHQADEEDFLLLRYEDLLEDSASEFSRVADFLGLDVTRERVNDVARETHISNLRSMEAGASDGQAVESDRRAYDKEREDINFFRSGKRDEWRERLEPEDLEPLETAWSDIMREMGYSPVSV